VSQKSTRPFSCRFNTLFHCEGMRQNYSNYWKAILSFCSINQLTFVGIINSLLISLRYWASTPAYRLLEPLVLWTSLVVWHARTAFYRCKVNLDAIPPPQLLQRSIWMRTHLWRILYFNWR
jgi:hypothetical protein